MGSFPANAQDANKPFREAMDRVTKKRTVDPVLPGDEDSNCLEIRAELARLDRQLANGTSALRAPIDAEDMARPAEIAEYEAVKKARDAANRVAPMGMAPGNLIEEAYREKAKIRNDIRQMEYVMSAAKLAKDFSFIAARIPYLHELASERCGSKDENEQGKIGN
jgi:hypothetical protein